VKSAEIRRNAAITKTAPKVRSNDQPTRREKASRSPPDRYEYRISRTNKLSVIDLSRSASHSWSTARRSPRRTISKRGARSPRGSSIRQPGSLSSAPSAAVTEITSPRSRQPHRTEAALLRACARCTKVGLGPLARYVLMQRRKTKLALTAQVLFS